LQEDLVLPDENEVSEHAKDLACMMMSSWLELLRDALSKFSSVPLTEDLLPPREAVRPEFWRAFADTIAPFAINEAEAAQIRKDVGMKLFGRRDTWDTNKVFCGTWPSNAAAAIAGDKAFTWVGEPKVALPFNLCLQRVGNRYHSGCLVAIYQTDDRDGRIQVVNQSLDYLQAALAR
jgi:hypothetical protein